MRGAGDDPRSRPRRVADRARRRRGEGRGRGARGGVGGLRRTKVPPLKVVDAPDKDGWTRIRLYDYLVSPNEKRNVGAFARFANDTWTVVLYDMADAVGEKRGGAGQPDARPPPAEGPDARVVRGQKGESARQGADRRARQVRRDRAEEARGAGGLDRPRPEWQGRLRGRVRRAGARQEDARGRRHAVHGRLEYEGLDDVDAREARRREEAHVGDAGDEPAALVQARGRGHDEPRARQAPHLRVHGPAAAGPRVDLPVQGRDARGRDGHARDDAADQQIRRALPVFESARRGGRFPRRARGLPQARSRQGLRRGDAHARVRAARDEGDLPRFQARADGQFRGPARAGRSTARRAARSGRSTRP